MFDLSKEDKYFISQIKNVIELCEKNNYSTFSLFLDEKQIKITEDILHKEKCVNYTFSGGYDNALRKMLCVYPDYVYSIDDVDFPFCNLQVSWSKNFSLSHRDFLGSLMALNIKREMIGDILVFEDNAVIILHERVVEYIKNNLLKVGNVGVKLKQIDKIEQVPEVKFEKIEGIVASFRVDCIVSMITKLSRSKSTDLLNQGLVSINHQPVKNITFILKPTDILSIRGYGKFILTDNISQTKKGRYHIVINKFI